jgi:2-deoxy-D-gluconate 3-dehydrogenase
LLLAEAGARVACHGNTRSPDETCGHIRTAGGEAYSVTGDLSKSETARHLVEQTLDHFGRIDILVNNAGTIRRAPAVEYSEEDWTAVLEVNLSSVFRLCQLAGKHMVEGERGGKIVNIASLLSFQGGITVPAYAASKGGVAQLTKHSPTSGLNIESMSTQLPRATCGPPTPPRCKPMKSAIAKSSNGFPPDAGVRPKMLRALQYS